MSATRNKTKSMHTLLMVLLLTTVFSHQLYADTGHNEQSTLPKYVFAPSNDNVEKAKKAVITAKEGHKLAMVVLGAQWCHDSRALAAQFSTASMQTILNEHYEVTFIDVAYLEDRRDITEMFNYPTYFATPTVMIIDPISGELVNIETLPTWSNSASVEHKDFIKAFSNTDALLANGGHQALSASLVSFEKAQAQRLQNAYTLLRPNLEKDASKSLTDPAEFYAKWSEIRAFRSQLQTDIHALRKVHAGYLSNELIESKVQTSGSWEAE